jgi:hypothetical protein
MHREPRQALTLQRRGEYEWRDFDFCTIRYYASFARNATPAGSVGRDPCGWTARYIDSPAGGGMTRADVPG